MSSLKRLCVYCGSSRGSDPEFTDAAVELGEALAARGIGLVYGGGAVGLMGVVADAVMAGGGRVTGVIPDDHFADEVAHTEITELLRVDSMHERKQQMHDLADAFVALPGGLGTLEELTEVLSWSRIGLIDKPVGVVDIADYWAPLFAQLDRMADSGLLRHRDRLILLRDASPTALLDRLIAQAD